MQINVCACKCKVVCLISIFKSDNAEVKLILAIGPMELCS